MQSLLWLKRHSLSCPYKVNRSFQKLLISISTEKKTDILCAYMNKNKYLFRGILQWLKNILLIKWDELKTNFSNEQWILFSVSKSESIDMLGLFHKLWSYPLFSSVVMNQLILPIVFLHPLQCVISTSVLITSYPWFIVTIMPKHTLTFLTLSIFLCHTCLVKLQLLLNPTPATLPEHTNTWQWQQEHTQTSWLVSLQLTPSTSRTVWM